MGGIKPWHVLILVIVLVIVVAVVAAIVTLVVVLTRRAASGARPAQTPSSAGPSARELLDRRLATGEITPEQYEQLRRTLE